MVEASWLTFLKNDFALQTFLSVLFFIWLLTKKYKIAKIS